MQINSRIISAAFLLTSTLLGCSSDQINEATSASPIYSKAAPSERPWKGECDVDAVFTSATVLLITGTCELAHLGRVTLVAYQTIDPGVFPIAYTNATTYTAANGDELRTTDVGTATPNAGALVLSGQVTAIGGTGRFANASGNASLDGAVRFTSPVSTTGSYALSGRISY